MVASLSTATLQAHIGVESTRHAVTHQRTARRKRGRKQNSRAKHTHSWGRIAAHAIRPMRLGARRRGAIAQPTQTSGLFLQGLRRLPRPRMPNCTELAHERSARMLANCLRDYRRGLCLHPRLDGLCTEGRLRYRTPQPIVAPDAAGGAPRAGLCWKRAPPRTPRRRLLLHRRIDFLSGGSQVRMKFAHAMFPLSTWSRLGHCRCRRRTFIYRLVVSCQHFYFMVFLWAAPNLQNRSMLRAKDAYYRKRQSATQRLH